MEDFDQSAAENNNYAKKQSTVPTPNITVWKSTAKVTHCRKRTFRISFFLDLQMTEILGSKEANRDF